MSTKRLCSRRTLGKPDSDVDNPVPDELQDDMINPCLGHLRTLTSALKEDFMIFVQSKSSKLGAICTTQLIVLSGCVAKYRHARLPSLGSENVTKAVDTAGWWCVARARSSVM